MLRRVPGYIRTISVRGPVACSVYGLAPAVSVRLWILPSGKLSTCNPGYHQYMSSRLNLQSQSSYSMTQNLAGLVAPSSPRGGCSSV